MKTHHRASGSVSVCLAAIFAGFILSSQSLFAEAPAAPAPPVAPVAASKELKEYVAKADPSYHFDKRRVGAIGESSYAELILTSQTWRDIVWKHQLLIVKPKEVREGVGAILLIDGGRWKDDLTQPVTAGAAPPKELLPYVMLAEQLKSPIVIVRHVPFQPMFGGLVEDQIISYTFEQYVRTGDSTWPLLLPMVKSAVRAMDAAQTFARDEWKVNIDHFTLTGASKRGWTTWLTAAVDPRVTALAPMVIDTLNMGVQTAHQLETWGRFSEQLDDYTRRGIQKYAFTPTGIQLARIIDPYNYRADIKQPKLILLATNDRYWPLDSLNYYWSDLQGEKHVLYVPNNGHGLRDFERVFGTIAALHRHAAGELTLPNLTWERDDNNDRLRLDIQSDVKPAKVVAWIATSPTKDFREAKWTSQPAAEVEGGFRCDEALPKTGYKAMFGEARYEQGGAPFFFSTTVKITPAVIPAASAPAAKGAAEVITQ